MNLIDAARPAAALLRSVSPEARVRVIAHEDPDGVASAAVLVRALRRLGRRFHVTYTRDHGDEYFRRLAEDDEAVYLFLDIGAGHESAISRLPGAKIVLDHHPGAKAATDPRFVVVNAHLIGEDGTRDACGATTCLAFAVALDEANWAEAPLALAGAWGDRQQRGGLQGFNETVLTEGLRRGTVTTRIFLGVEDLPLMDLLARPATPLDATVVAPEGVAAALQAHGLPTKATPYELAGSEAETLGSLVATRLLRSGTAAYKVKELFRPVPTSPQHGGLFVPRMASLLQAATREQETGLGLAFLLGDAGARTELEALETRYHDTVRSALDALAATGARTLNGFHLFPVTAIGYTGEVTQAAMERVLKPTHASLGYSIDEAVVRVSARAPDALVRRGIDLGTALEKAAGLCGGTGGGHAVAAGATIPRAHWEDFVSAADAVVAAQLRGAS